MCAQRQKTESGPSSESSSEPAVFDAEDAAAKAKIEAMEAEGGKAGQARVAEDKKKASADQKAMKAMSKTDKVALLEQYALPVVNISQFYPRPGVSHVLAHRAPRDDVRDHMERVRRRFHRKPRRDSF